MMNSYDCHLPNQLYGNLVVGAPGNDDVGELLGGHAELLVGRLHKAQVVLQHLVQITAQLLCVLNVKFSLFRFSGVQI